MNYTQFRRFRSSLRELHESLDMNNTAFAALLGIGRTTLGEWYAGTSKPEPETVERMLNTLAKQQAAYAKNADAMLGFIALNTPGECD